MHQRSPVWKFVAAMLFVIAMMSAARACSVPVFRYALERWPADNYHVTVLHRGALTEAQRALIDGMNPESPTGAKTANLRVRTVDLDDKSAGAETAKSRDELVARLDGKLPDALPAMVVEYPVENPPAWVGPLNAENVKALLESPARREVARRLLKGQTAVWVFLDSGDKAADDAAFKTLQTELALAGLNIKLPEIDEQDVSDGLVSIKPDELRVDFSILRIVRTDPAEKLFIEMLLGSEGVGPESLRDPELTNKPMTFPIFGRGRALYALVDKGINEETIATACKTLVGPCTCEVKDKNPGVDLVMSINWNDLVEATIDIDKELPPLTGLANFADAEKSINGADSNQQIAEVNIPPNGSSGAVNVKSSPDDKKSTVATESNSANKSESSQAKPIAAVPASPQNDTSAGGMNSIAWNTVMLVGLVAAAVVVGSLFVIRRG